MSEKKVMRRPLKGLSHLEIEKSLSGNESSGEIGIQLPKDMYLHTPKTTANPDGCPTEWWWHIGTLKTETGRVFGFEINAAAFYPAGFTEVMLTDVKNKKHYHQTKPDLGISDSWAEIDPSKEWQVNLEDVSMKAPQADPTQNMTVKAKLVDGDTTVEFDLTLSQQGKPLIVWGNGVLPAGPPKPTLNNNNFYFSLTRLQAQGTIKVITTGSSANEETHNVSGVTWMDHEWGKFGSKDHPVKWILQDMQLENGVCISNYSLTVPELNTPSSGMATVQSSGNDPSYFVPTTITPKASTVINGKTYFTEVLVVIPNYGASLTVKSLLPDQTFEGGVYEGVGTVSGTMKIGAPIVDVSGTAWLEQTN